MNRQKKAQTINISPLRGGHPPEPIDMLFGVLSGVPDVIVHAKFCVNRLRGFSVAAPRKVPFPILLERPLQQFCTTVQTVIVTDILSRNVSELSQLIVQISDSLHFRATLWGFRDNVRCSSWAHWKARSGLPISIN